MQGIDSGLRGDRGSVGVADLAIQVQALKTRMDTVLPTLATRAQLAQEFGALRSEMKQEIGDLRSEMKHELGVLRSELKQEVGGLRRDQGLDRRTARGDASDGHERHQVGAGHRAQRDHRGGGLRDADVTALPAVLAGP